MSIIAEDEKTELRRYLLGQLGEPEEEQLEMRLLTESAFVEEFDMMVDEITASYVAGKFAGEEKEQVERYFLRAPERRKKLEFMTELLDQIPGARDRGARPSPSFAERVRAFFSGPHFLPRFATAAMAVVLLVVGGVWLSRSGGPATTKFYVATLTISNAERDVSGPSAQPTSIKLPADVNELRLELLPPPSQTTQPVTYRAELALPNVRRLTITGQDSRAVVVAVPVSELKPDRYAIRLFMIRPDGQEERVPGNYSFRVE